MEFCSGQWIAGPPILEQHNYAYDQNHSGFNTNGLHGLVHVDTDDLTCLYKNELKSDLPVGFNDLISFTSPPDIPGEVSTDDFDIIGTNDEVLFLSDTKVPSLQPSDNYGLNPTCTYKINDPSQSCNPLNPAYMNETKTPSNDFPLNTTYTNETKTPSNYFSLNTTCINETKTSSNDFPLNTIYTNETKAPFQPCKLNPTYTYEAKASSQLCTNYLLNPSFMYENKAIAEPCNIYQLNPPLNPIYTCETKAPAQPCNNYLLNSPLNTTYTFEAKAPSQPCNNYLLNSPLNTTYTFEVKAPSQPCNNYLLNSPLNTTYTFEAKGPSQPCSNYSIISPLNPAYTNENRATSHPCNNYPLDLTYTCETKVPPQPCNNYLLNSPLNTTYTSEIKAPSQSNSNYSANLSQSWNYHSLDTTYTFESKAPSQPCNNYLINPLSNSTNNFETKATSFYQGPDNQSFHYDMDNERAQDISNEVSNNSTLENPSPPIFPMHTNTIKTMPPLCPYPQLNDLDCYETKPSIAENAQGLAQPCCKRTRKPSKPKAKTSTEKVLKVVSAAELESDEWVWEKYGRKKMASTLQRTYYKCAEETCEAKRHVDKNDSDRNTYIVTYFGNHNHIPPTDSSPVCKKKKVC